MLVEVNRETEFLDELSHAGASRARSPHRPQQVLGALVAAATGIGYAKMSQASSFTERELRSASERHLVDEHLDAGSARILRHLRLLPHTAIFDDVLTSSDGQRYETIGKSSIAASAAREVGYRKRMITWLLWLTGQYGHFGSKVIPVTEPESWHTLDALMQSANSLRRAVGYGNRGRVRAQDPEQLHRHMEARRLVANAIGYWNARYIALSFKALERTGWTLPDHDVRRVHYMHHEHINFIGRHTGDMRRGPPKGKHRPLRLPAPQATLHKSHDD